MATATFADRSGPGGVVHNPASPYSREMAKWEMGYSPYGPPGRPREVVGRQEWPALFYKVSRSRTNGDFVVESMQEAADETEARNLQSRGYVQGRAAAEAACVEAEQRLAYTAAERNAQDRHMGEKAKAEADAYESRVSGHVAEIPETPLKPKRGRPAKTIVTA